MALTYNHNLANVKVSHHTKYQGCMSNGSAMRVETEGRTDRWTLPSALSSCFAKLHSRMLLVLNSILLCTPMLSRSYKKHWCLLNGLPGSYKHKMPTLLHKMAMQKMIAVRSGLSLLCTQSINMHC